MTGIVVKRKPIKLKENMTPAQVKRKRINIYDKIKKLNEQIAELQSLCTHLDVTKKYKGDTGNYDPSADSYWIEWRCPDCGKFWITDQDRENSLKPGRVID